VTINPSFNSFLSKTPNSSAASTTVMTRSEADIKVKRDPIRGGQVLEIEVLDHLILGPRTEERPRDFVSLRELGYFL
jgi:DNA repair protein RadC